MTLQECLAEALGQAGLCGRGIPPRQMPRRVPELLGLSENIRIDSNLRLELYQEPGCGWGCLWVNVQTEERFSEGWQEHQEDAQMECAIEGLERLKEEKDAN